jgi:beta-lactamase class C
MQLTILRAVVAALCVCGLRPSVGNAADKDRAVVQAVIANAITPMMARYGIPGMAVGVVLDGQTYVFDYGVASKSPRKPVTDATLFEIGSVSKTFTATLAAYAQVSGHLSLSDSASRYLPELRGSSFDTVSLINLGTHTPGGLPLQVPDGIANDDELMTFFRAWKPAYAPGTERTYSNLTIGMLGMIAARSMDQDFVALMDGKLFPALGMKHSYIDVPRAQADNYAQGYTKADVPIRLTESVLAAEAYGVRTTAGDLLRFVEANMGMVNLDPVLQRAITATHTGYYRVGAMTQGLVWEQYRYQVALKDVLEGNSGRVALRANPAVRLDPPSPPANDVLINKTGSTSGFGAYVAFVPARRTGIVLLANKNYPIDARVTVVGEMLMRLAGDGQHDAMPGTKE